MRKPDTYLDTSVISVYVADKATDNVSMVQRRSDTKAFWGLALSSVKLMTSELAVEEGDRGHPRQVRRRQLLQGVRLVRETRPMRKMAARFAAALGRHKSNDYDLRHIAAAYFARAELFVTWDEKLLEKRTVRVVDEIAARSGKYPMEFMTPEEALSHLGGQPRTNPVASHRKPIPVYIRKIVAKVRAVRERLRWEEEQRERAIIQRVKERYQ